MTLSVRIISILIVSVLFSACGKRDDEAARLIEERFMAVNDTSAVTADSALMSAIALTAGREDVCGGRASYLSGRIELDRMNFPAAMRDFLNADRIFVATGDFGMALKSRKAMMELSGKLYSVNGEAEFGRKLYEVLDRAGVSDSIRCGVYEDIIIATSDTDRPFAQRVADEYADFAMETGDSSKILYAGIYKRIASRRPNPDVFGKNYSGKWNGWSRFEVFKSRLRALKDVAGFELPDTVAVTRTNIHDFVVELWNKGESVKAGRFLQLLLERYENDDMKRPWITDFGYPNSPYIYGYESPSCKGLLQTFQSEVDDVVRRFDYEELKKKEVSIAYQRMSIAVLLFILAVGVWAGIFYLRLQSRRARRHKQELTDSVKELDAALRRSQKALFRNVSSLCDTYYKSCVDGNTKIAKNALKAIEEFVKTPGVFSELESVLDAESDGMMERFRRAMPELREDEYRLFLCNALGFSVPALMMLLGEKREVIYNRRLRLRAKIAEVSPDEARLFIEKLV